MPSMNDVLGVIMGGGKGTRLHPLTKMRSKPAVPMLTPAEPRESVDLAIVADG